MAAGSASWADISGTINFIHDNAMAVARSSNLLVPTVTNLSANGMFLRKQWEWNAVTFSTHTEEEDEASQVFDKDLISTLTPYNYHARVDLTDERVASDPDGARAAAAFELGSAASKHVDKAIASLFGTATAWAGTIGVANAGTAANGTISWRAITKALAILTNADIPAGAPVFCALHTYQWEVLLQAATIAGASVSVAPAFQDRMQVANYFNVPDVHGVTFVVTNSISVASTAAYGLLYVPQTLAVDTRKGFGLEPQRDASKQAWELNASMWYAYGVRRPAHGVLLRFQAATPSWP